jgi:hypothetical protein
MVPANFRSPCWTHTGRVSKETGPAATCGQTVATALLSKDPHLTPYEVKTVLRAVIGYAVAQGASDED